jgi:endonuclease/exonuclease/phosphatase family metal-dependent hydrolase
LDGPYGPLHETRLRVVSWNLWWRFGPWEERAPAIEATLRSLDADVVCLQEVWGLDGGATSFASVLGEALGYHHVYAQRLEWAGPDGEHDRVLFGNAILSRWPIASTAWWPLPAREDAEEHRTLVFAELDGPRGPVQVFCTHLNWRFDHSDVRQEQVAFICDRIESTRPRRYPPILCGDMNAPPDSTEMMMLTGKTSIPVPKLVFHDAWEMAGDGPGHTWSNENPYAQLDLEVSRRIDFVYSGWPRAGGAGHCVSAEMIGRAAVDGVVPSDHYGVLAELRY